MFDHTEATCPRYHNLFENGTCVQWRLNNPRKKISSSSFLDIQAIQ